MEKWVYLVARKTYELGTFYLCDPEGDEYCAMVAVTLSAAMQRLGSGEIELYLKDCKLIDCTGVSKLAAVELWAKSVIDARCGMDTHLNMPHEGSRRTVRSCSKP